MDLTGRLLMVTGAGGFIGLRVCEVARARGHRVRGLELDPEAARRVAATGAEVVVGDVSDPEAARVACAGAAAVVHAAAVVREDGPRELFERVNVEGTRVVAAAARAAGARKLVHLSSVMVYGFAYPAWVTEAGPLSGDGHPYNETKIAGEQVLPPLVRPGVFDAVVLRPGDVYGPGSQPWIVRPLEFWRRHLFALPDLGRGFLNHLYIDNLVDAIFTVLERDDAVGPYNVTDGRATTCAEFYGRLGRMVGHRFVPKLPSGAMGAVVGVLAQGARAIGRPAPVPHAALAFLSRPHPVSSERIRTELGWRPAVGLEQGLAWTAAWVLREIEGTRAG